MRVLDITVPTLPLSQLEPDEIHTLLELVLIFIFSWSLAFFLSKFVLFPQRTHDFNNRVVSVLHVFAAIILSTLSVEDWKNPLKNVGGPNSKGQALTILVSMSYFIYDFFCCLLEVPIDWITQIHHVFTILGFAYGTISGRCGTELVACLWLMELSNPCMHFRELFKELNLKDSSVSLMNDVLFALTFTVARMLIGPYIVIATLKADSPLPVKLGAIGIQLVSIFWFYKILRVIYFKVLKKGKGRKEAKTE